MPAPLRLERPGSGRHIGRMTKGRELQCAKVASWEGTAGLLLNPRMPPAWRERIMDAAFPDLPGHVWLATSGTGGRIKIIALSRAALEASAAAVNSHLAATANDIWINPLPLFHAGGLGIAVRAALAGARWESFGPWDARQFARCAAEQGATLSSLVPAQVHDLVRANLTAPPSLRAAVVGGGALDETLRAAAAALGWPLLPSYGMTETSSQVATAAPGEADTAWLPLLPHAEARTDEAGILSLRGPSLLTGWMLFDAAGSARWEDPKTAGWFRTGDRCVLRGRLLRVLGRADDLIKMRGELVDAGALERALQAHVASGLVRLDVEPDDRNGANLHVIAENISAESEAKKALDLFPAYARPTSFRVAPIPLSPLGKKIRPSSKSP